MAAEILVSHKIVLYGMSVQAFLYDFYVYTYFVPHVLQRATTCKEKTHLDFSLGGCSSLVQLYLHLQFLVILKDDVKFQVDVY